MVTLNRIQSKQDLRFVFSVTDKLLLESKDSVSDYETAPIKNEPLSDTDEKDASQPLIGECWSEESANERLLGEVTISTKSEVSSDNNQIRTETTKVKSC